MQPVDDRKLPLPSMVLQLRRVDGLPDQRRRSAVRADEVEGDRRVPVLVEFRPVESDENLLPTRNNLGDPLREPVPDLDPRVAQEPVDLLDRVLRIEVERIGMGPSLLGSPALAVGFAASAVCARSRASRRSAFCRRRPLRGRLRCGAELDRLASVTDPQGRLRTPISLQLRKDVAEKALRGLALAS